MNPSSAIEPASAAVIDGAGRTERRSWLLGEGAEIAPGRAVLKPIGGGSLYEVQVVWDERLHSICVAKLLRPDQVDDRHALREPAPAPVPGTRATVPQGATTRPKTNTGTSRGGVDTAGTT